MNRVKLSTVLAASLFSLGAFAAEYNISFQSYYPSSMLQAEREFAKEVNENSEGRIEIKVYSGGELVDSSEILAAVKADVIQMGRGMGHHFTEQSIGGIESGLPLAWMSIDEAEKIYTEDGLFDLVSEEYDNRGVHYLGPIWAAPYHFLSKRPMNSLEDLKNMKIRAVGASGKMLKELGVNVVSMPPEDIYLALTTGQIDGVLYGTAFEYKETKYYEAARFFNKTPVLNPIVDTLIINDDLWNNLDDDLKNIVNEASAKLRVSYYNWLASEDEKTIEELFRNTSTEFSDEDISAMKEAALKIWEQEAQRSTNNKKAVDILKNNL